MFLKLGLNSTEFIHYLKRNNVEIQEVNEKLKIEIVESINLFDFRRI